jgi:peptide/nickel transport system permease protein
MSERDLGVAAVALPMAATRRAVGRGVSCAARGPWSEGLRILLANRVALAGGVVLALTAIAAILAPVIAPHDPFKTAGTRILRPPSVEQPFGSDYLGRDVLSRVLYGGRLSLRVGAISVAIALTCGLALGVFAGASGGWPDALIMRAMDVLLAFPGVLLALAIIAVLGPGLSNVMVAVGISHVPQYTRVVRASVLATTNDAYVAAARAIGCGDARLMLVHILPNALTPVIAVATLGVPTAILVAAGLSFLGLGVQPPTPEWGAMVSGGREYLRNGWWISTFPGLMIAVTVLSIHLLGDGLREAFDPVLKRH